MNAEFAALRLRSLGYQVKEYPNGHLRVIRRRQARFQGPRIIAWWPASRRRTAYDENCDHTWAPATIDEVIQAVDANEDATDPNIRTVS